MILEKSSLAKDKALITVVSLVVIGFYVTGLYRNLLQIEKLKKNETL